MHADDIDWLLAPLPSGRHGLPREEVVRSQRMRLLRAAVEVAGSEGYAAMTVSAVIARASVSRKTFYELFADREDCFLAAYELLAERALRGAQAAFAIDAPWSARLRAALGWTLDALAEHPHEARVAFVEVLGAGPRALAHRERTLAQLARLIAEGREVALPAVAVPASTPIAVIGALGELIGAQIRRGAVAELPALLPDLLYCALAPFLGPVAAAEVVADEPQALAGAHREP